MQSNISISREFINTRRNVEYILSKLPSRDRSLYKRFDAVRRDYFRSYWQAVANDINADIENLGYDYFRLVKDGKKTFVRYGEVMLDDHLTLAIAGNKPLVNKLLKEAGYHVPEFCEYKPETLSTALSFMHQHRGNFVVKPANASGGGRGITTKVNNRTRLVKSSYKAAIHSTGSKLIIEKEHSGKNCRLLYLNGEFIDALQRDAPAVTGDGKNSIRNLIRNENNKRLEALSPYALSPLTIDLDTRYTLLNQGLSLNDVPTKGQKLRVKTATNQCSRFENHTVKNSIHPSIVDYGRNISRVINVTLSGVDLMINDHSVAVEDSGCIVNEINTTPGLHHHELISSPRDKVNVGSIVVNYIFDNEESR